MASDIWLRTILIVIDRQDNTYHGICYTSRGALAGTRDSSMGPLFNEAVNTFYLQLYGYISSKKSFICTILQTGYLIARPLLLPCVYHEESIRGPSYHEQTYYNGNYRHRFVLLLLLLVVVIVIVVVVVVVVSAAAVVVVIVVVGAALLLLLLFTYLLTD